MNIFDPKELALLQIDPEENTSLENLLTNKNLPLLQLLSIKNIQPKIRSNFTLFIKYCQRNEDFCFNLIDIGIKCPMHEGSNDNMKQVCYIAADVLTCDQDVVADLLILPDKSKPKKNQSDQESGQFEQIEENIDTEANHSAGPQQTQLFEEGLSEQQKFNKKYKYLMRIFEYIGQKQDMSLDENCINYMLKSLNCLIRKKGEQFIDFLTKKPQILQKLIHLNQYSSVNQFLIKILSDDEIEGENSDKIKKLIIEGVLKKIIESVKQEDFTERLDFLEQLFQTNKYASEDDRTQLQKLSDIFSSKQTILFFYEHMQKASTPIELFNSISYLNSIVKRMNVDQEIDPYSYSNEPELKQETMQFEMDVLFKQFPQILSEGYKNLNQIKYSEQYKQKILQTKFYELLVLLTKNSRLNNCFNTKPKQQNWILTGNNIIWRSKEQKLNSLKEILKQFVNQSGNGINRICLIALIEKILTVQIFETLNHTNDDKNEQNTCKSQKHSSSKNEQSQKKNEDSLKNSTQKLEKLNSSQQDEAVQGQDKKKKINKIKAGLKLNIKKFSLQPNEPTQKSDKQTQDEAKKEQTSKTNIVKRRQSSLTREEVLELIKFLAEELNNQTQVAPKQPKQKQRNKQTELGALINKIIMIFASSVNWSEYSQNILAAQKQKFINEIQKMFPEFHFEDICNNYSVTLATTKHPNASAKQKTNPELTFTSQFFRIYSTKKQLSPEKPKDSSNKNLQLSDSDFKSDEEEVHAVKCSIEDFKKFTSFKFENKSPVKTQQNPSTSQTPQIQQEKVQPQTQSSSSNQKSQEQTTEPKIINQQKIQISKQKSEQIKQKQQKQVAVQLPDKNKTKEEKISNKDVAKEQKIPLQFYIKHRVILV